MEKIQIEAARIASGTNKLILLITLYQEIWKETRKS